MIARTLAVLLLICAVASLANSAPAADQVSNSIAKLSGINKYDRRAAMEILGASKDRRAIQPLIARLGVQEDGKYAAIALAAIGTAALDPVVESLASKNPFVRGNAARALGLIKNEKAVKPLLGMLKDPEPRVRVMAIEALAFSKDPAVTAKMLTIYNNPEEEYEVQEAACDTIVRIGDPEAIDKLIARLADGGETGPVIKALAHLPDLKAVRAVAATIQGVSPWEVADVWAETGEPMVPPFVTLLRDPDASVRFGAAWGLRAVARRAKDERALKALSDAVEDSDSEVRLEVMRALATYGGDAIIEPLAVALHDTDPKVRQGALMALQGLKTPKAVDLLCALLRDPDVQNRRSAAYALLESPDPRSADALLQAIGDSDSSVRHAVLLALGATKDSRAFEPLMAALKSPDPSARRAGAGGMGRLGGKEVVEPLIAALKDLDAEVRRTAAAWLGSIGDARAVDPLIELLKISEKEARSEIADALEYLKDPRAVKPMLEIALADPKEEIGILMTLAEMGDTSAVEPIISLLDDKKLNREDRGTMLWLLGKFKDKRATPVLIAALKEDELEYGHTVVESLMQIRDPRAFEALANIVGDTESFNRWNAAYALSLLDDPRVEEFLVPYAEKGDTEVIVGADPFFIKRGIERAIPGLIDGLNRMYRDSDLAEAFIRSGQPELVEAARQWKEKHPRADPPDEDRSYPRWGEART